MIFSLVNALIQAGIVPASTIALTANNARSTLFSTSIIDLKNID